MKQHKFITGFYNTSSSPVSTAQVHNQFLQHKFITCFYSASSSLVSTAQVHHRFLQHKHMEKQGPFTSFNLPKHQNPYRWLFIHTILHSHIPTHKLLILSFLIHIVRKKLFVHWTFSCVLFNLLEYFSNFMLASTTVNINFEWKSLETGRNLRRNCWNFWISVDSET